MLSDLSLALTSPQKFFEWLQSQPEGSVVGTSCKITGCPIANFLNSLIERPFYASVSPNYLGKYSKEDGSIAYWEPVPSKWVGGFMWAVDKDNERPITREEAMRIVVALSENAVEESVVDPVTV